MPQLRHAHTSALVAEADDPLELALIADALGSDLVVFDGVGSEFDPAAALAAARERRELTAAHEARAVELEGPVAQAVAATLEVLEQNPDAGPVIVEPAELEPAA